MLYHPDTPPPPGSGPPEPGTFAAVGRFAARRRRPLLAAWILLFVAGIAVGSGVFARLKDSNGSSSAESVRGATLLQNASTHGMPLVAVVDGPPVDDPSTRRAVLAAAHPVAHAPRGPPGATPHAPHDPTLR